MTAPEWKVWQWWFWRWVVDLRFGDEGVVLCGTHAGGFARAGMRDVGLAHARGPRICTLVPTLNPGPGQVVP